MIHWIASFWNYFNSIEKEYFNSNETWIDIQGLS